MCCTNVFLQKTENNSRTTDNNKTVKTKDLRNEIGLQKVLLKLCLRKQTAELKFKMRIRVCKDLTVQLPRCDSKSETDKLLVDFETCVRAPQVLQGFGVNLLWTSSTFHCSDVTTHRKNYQYMLSEWFETLLSKGK